MAVVMHIDANSAYLSWEAAARLEAGAAQDLREIPSAVAGDPKNRHGIILARSIPAKRYGVRTGESLREAREKCPELVILPPDYDLYLGCSDAMYEVLCRYSPVIQRYSVDECFLDYTASQKRFGDPVAAAHEIRERIREELGFTVNVGVGPNKILAKMASELEKPDKVHTIWSGEVADKLWPLPVSELFMVGPATARKLRERNIRTIGDLARQDPHHMKAMLKSQGVLVWSLANGIDESPVVPNDEIVQKGMGNGTTIAYDVTTRKEALLVLLGLTERVGARLRRFGRVCSLLSVSVKNSAFQSWSHQRQLPYHTSATSEIFSHVEDLFGEMWRGDPIRYLGVHLSGFARDRSRQISLFDGGRHCKEEAADRAVDRIREKYGDLSIMRGCFANGPFSPVQGGLNEGNYIGLGGYRS